MPCWHFCASAARSMAGQEQLRIAAAAVMTLHRSAAAAVVQLQLLRYAVARGEPCYELQTGRGGTTRPTRHPMMLFYRNCTKGGSVTEPMAVVPR
jgi:hypothetical protein